VIITAGEDPGGSASASPSRSRRPRKRVARPGAAVTTLGHVVHNPQMVAQLEEKGLRDATRLKTSPTARPCSSVLTACRFPCSSGRKEKNLTVIDAKPARW